MAASARPPAACTTTLRGTATRCVPPGGNTLTDPPPSPNRHLAGVLEQLQAMYKDWPWFRTTVSLVEMVLAKSDAKIAKDMAAAQLSLAVLVELRESTLKMAREIRMARRKTKRLDELILEAGVSARFWLTTAISAWHIVPEERDIPVPYYL